MSPSSAPAAPTPLVLVGGTSSQRARLAAALVAALQKLARPSPAVALPHSPDDLGAIPSGTALCLLLAAPWSGSGLDETGAEATEARWRAALQAAGRPFRVLHGSPAEQQAQALRAIDGALAPRALSASAAWAWSCEKCSDPQCEHRLFQRLVAPGGDAAG